MTIKTIKVNYIPSELKARYYYINKDILTGRVTTGVQFDPLDEYLNAVTDWGKAATRIINRNKTTEDTY